MFRQRLMREVDLSHLSPRLVFFCLWLCSVGSTSSTCLRDRCTSACQKPELEKTSRLSTCHGPSRTRRQSHHGHVKSQKSIENLKELSVQEQEIEALPDKKVQVLLKRTKIAHIRYWNLKDSKRFIFN